MSYMRHNAIVVTSFKMLDYVAAKAREMGAQVLGPSEPSINGYSTLLICPDGSKEGWDDSNAGDARRAALRELLNGERYEDNSTPLEWAEVQYGGDDRAAVVVHYAWDARGVQPTGGIDRQAPKKIRGHTQACGNKQKFETLEQAQAASRLTTTCATFLPNFFSRVEKDRNNER